MLQRIIYPLQPTENKTGNRGKPEDRPPPRHHAPPYSGRMNTQTRMAGCLTRAGIIAAFQPETASDLTCIPVLENLEHCGAVRALVSTKHGIAAAGRSGPKKAARKGSKKVVFCKNEPEKVNVFPLFLGLGPQCHTFYKRKHETKPPAPQLRATPHPFTAITG